MKNGILTAILVSISLLAATSIAQDNGSVGSHSSQIQQDEQGSMKQAIENRIAGLRPGKDTIDKAYRRFHKDRMFKEVSTPSSAVWADWCNHIMLTVGFDTRRIIRDVEIGFLPGEADCDFKAYSRSVRARIGGTGRGLVFKDSCDRIQQIYGAPQSQQSSVRAGDKEFLYRFDHAVKGSSLTLECTCFSDRNQVAAIKLTASSPANPEPSN